MYTGSWPAVWLRRRAVKLHALAKQSIHVHFPHDHDHVCRWGEHRSHKGDADLYPYA